MTYLRWLLTVIRYRIRPFDMLADRRRWWWQPSQRCVGTVAAVWGTCRLNQTPHWCINQTPHWCITLGYEEAEIAAKYWRRSR